MATGHKADRRKTSIIFTEPWGITTCHTLGLTFAGLRALKPPVLYVSIAGTSTVLKPSTARSATTVSAGFRKRAAFWARHHTRGR